MLYAGIGNRRFAWNSRSLHAWWLYGRRRIGIRATRDNGINLPGQPVERVFPIIKQINPLPGRQFVDVILAGHHIFRPRTGITISFCWLATASSFLISSELLALAEKISTMTPASRIARTMAP